MAELTVAPLTALLIALGLEPCGMESATRLEINAEVKYSAVEELDFDTVRALVDAYGDALYATVAEGRLDLWLSHRPAEDGRPRRPLERGVFEDERSFLDPDAPHQLHLVVKKPVLVGRTFGPDRARAIVFWFFAASVERALTDLDAFGRDVWGEEADAGRLVLIGDADLCRTGPLLTVAGSANPPHPPVPDRVVLERVARMRAGSEDADWDARLTPEHLRLGGKAGATAVEGLLAGAYVQLFLRYTANRVQRTATGELRAEYRGGGASRVVVVLPATPPDNAVTAADALRQVLAWCYHGSGNRAEDWTADRIRFTQVEVAHRLEMTPEGGRLDVLLNTVAGLWDSLEDEYRAFIEGRITAYFEEQRKLEDLVREVVQRYGEQATALTKNLSDVMLGAVAALIGSAIAAAFKTPFDTGLFRVGVLAYTAYLVLVPGLYGISAQHGQFEALHRSFTADLARFARLLGEQKVNALDAAKRESEARARYRFWLRMTIAGFAAAAAIAGAAAWFVPLIVT